VIYQNYYENKINSHNFLDYFIRVLHLIGSEVIFDWLKGIMVFKLSNLDPQIYKEYYLELSIYHEQLKFNCFNTNGGQIIPKNSMFYNYTSKIEKFKLKIVNHDSMSNCTAFLDYENISAIAVGYTNVTICVLFITFLIKHVGFKLFSKDFFILVIILIIIQRINRLIISNLVVEKIDRCLVKNKITKKKN